jgi:hypothetical protein
MPKDKIDNNKRTFEVDGSQYAVRVPTVQEIKEANEMRAKTFNDALSRGDLLRDQLETELRKRELWNDDREQEYQTLRREVLDGEYKLQKGGVRLNQAKSIALDMSDKRSKMVGLLSSRTDLDSNTCEGKADAARFNYLFACCLVYDDSGEHFFPNKLDDYLLNQDDPVALAGATEFYYLISGSESVDETLPENQFLKKFKFVNDDLRLIDDGGKLVDGDGRHIDEEGNYITYNKDGTTTKVDPSGRPVAEDGTFDIEHSPFLDDSGKPIDESAFEEIAEDVAEEVEAESEAEEVAEEKPKPKRKRTTKKKPVVAEVKEADAPSDNATE